MRSECRFTETNEVGENGTEKPQVSQTRNLGYPRAAGTFKLGHPPRGCATCAQIASQESAITSKQPALSR